MKLSRTQKILIAAGATLIAGALFFSSKALAAGGQTEILPGNDEGIIITNHDTIYDYKYFGGIWYSRKKGALTWINLKKSLTAEKYALTKSRLRKYIS